MIEPIRLNCSNQRLALGVISRGIPMKRFNASGFVLVLFAASACATPYKPDGLMGGFSEIPVSADAYKVHVGGNGYTSAARVNEMALLRCAQLAKNAGYNYFVVADSRTYDRAHYAYLPGSSQTVTTGSATVSGNTAYGMTSSTTTFSPASIVSIFKPNVDMIVQFIPDEFAEQASALSVEQVYGLYADKYGLAAQ
ncbi:MAG: hypothetical protein R3C00_01235 [Hyphomonas sp.]